MNYKDILKQQLIKRQEVNSRYSLRSFAQKLSLSPSKLSEILAGKKRLSFARAEEIAEKLGLTSREKEIFILSAKLESSSKTIDKVEIKTQLKVLQQEVNNNKTTQKNAWYFGAISKLEDNGFDTKVYAPKLQITPLQTENAKRYIKRIKKLHPERNDLSYEPSSIMKKIEDSSFAQVNNSLKASFAFLTPDQIEELQKKIKNMIELTQLKNKNISPEDLCLIHWGTIQLINK